VLYCDLDSLGQDIVLDSCEAVNWIPVGYDWV
jgi:hypothetical protein